MSAKKLYAFPISKVFHLDLAGEEHFLGLRFRWNTGETEIAWEKPDVFKVGLIFEEPIPVERQPPWPLPTTSLAGFDRCVLR